MSDVPRLSPKEVAAKLQELCGEVRRHHYLFAFHGTGEEDLVDTPSAGRFHVVPVRSELELRSKMPPLSEEDPRIAFLVPWTASIPVDLAGRFAQNGRVWRIGREVRVARLFGVSDQSVDREASRSPLAEWLLAAGPRGPYAVGGGRLTVDAMWAAWLGADFGVPVTGGLALDSLLGWAAMDEGGRGASAALSGHGGEDVRAALLDYLRTKLGLAGPVVWQAWEAGRGRRALELAVLFEVAGPSEDAGVRVWTRMTSRSELGAAEADALAVAQELGRAAGGALRYVERQAGEGEVRSIVRAADGQIGDPEVRACIEASTRLPSSWNARLGTLGRVLAEGAGEPSADAVSRALEGLRNLEGHALFADPEHTRVAKRAEMAVRLLAWLAARRDASLPEALTPYGDAEALGQWYAEEGGYVDWARQYARGARDDALGRGIMAVVEAADRVRLELDRRFAKGLAGWIEARRPAGRLLPIDRAVERLAVKFLREDESRRLLVLLLDGMAWTQAVEILQSLGRRASPWGPAAWHQRSDSRIGEGAYPVVLANLPTVTEVSRAAFFAGKPMPPGKAQLTSKDPERWRDHREASKLFEPPEYPRLLLRGEGHRADGAASEEALSLVGDATRRIVAIVINAIDASLKGDRQQRHDWIADSIASLPDLLDKARQAGRAVMIAADHGHVPGDLMRSRGTPTGAKPRWRPWNEGDPVAEYEIAVRGEGVWAPKGADGVALLADEQSVYGGTAHAGEHGGATLAEVVTPCLILANEELALNDRVLEPKPAIVPSWWHFEVEPARTAPSSPPPPRKPPPKKSKVPESQLALLPETKPEPVAAEPPKLSPLADNAILEARAPSATLRNRTLRAVEFLRERNGAASVDAFAAAMDEIPWRVDGLISTLQMVLNVEGYPVLRLDSSARQVYLDVAKLSQLFEVDL